MLVIDDDRALRNALLRVFESAGWDARGAETGEEGIERIADEAPSVILLDQVMPGLTGTGLLAMLQGDPALASIPVVRMSGDKLPSRGPHFLAKPFSTRELFAVLERLGFSAEAVERELVASEKISPEACSP